MRNDKSVQYDTFTSAVDFYSGIRKGLREKSDHNKNESQLVFISALFCTLATPLFVTLGDGWLLGKLIPAVLSVLASAATAWLQLRKPQRLWAIYRRAQRELEREKSAYDFKFGAYENAADRGKLLASMVSKIVFIVHEQWESLVPESDALIAKALGINPKFGRSDDIT